MRKNPGLNTWLGDVIRPARRRWYYQIIRQTNTSTSFLYMKRCFPHGLDTVLLRYLRHHCVSLPYHHLVGTKCIDTHQNNGLAIPFYFPSKVIAATHPTFILFGRIALSSSFSFSVTYSTKIPKLESLHQSSAYNNINGTSTIGGTTLNLATSDYKNSHFTF